MDPLWAGFYTTPDRNGQCGSVAGKEGAGTRTKKPRFVSGALDRAGSEGVRKASVDLARRVVQVNAYFLKLEISAAVLVFGKR